MKKSIFLLVIFLLGSIPALAQSVDTAWVRIYNGPASALDSAYALAVDGSGNVYVTGVSYSYQTVWDYATVKYYSNGDTAWVRRYNGPGTEWDFARALAVDESGNVYVTGFSYGEWTGSDYATIKYFSNGDTAWVRRYNGPGDYEDEVRAVAVDGSGNVYVTGYSYGDGTGSDYATIKYYSNGDTAWLRRYTSPGGYWDEAYALAVDGSGNVYVTGYSYVEGLGADYATIKYYPNGDTAWLRIYAWQEGYPDEAYALTVDGSGNVYVTGMSFNDYATIKYYPNGDTAWVRRYNGPGNDYDAAVALTVDESGNVYVTGETDSSGISDYATIKYYSNGDTAWVRRYNGPGNSNDYAYAIAVDGYGNVYVTGGTDSSGTSDYATIKYYPNGDTAWVTRYNGPGNSFDWATDLALDDSGNIYLTGNSYRSGAVYDYATIKYVPLEFLCGDGNGDWEINLADPICLANHYFGKPCEINRFAADVNCDHLNNLGDAIIIANYYFGKPGFELNCCP